MENIPMLYLKNVKSVVKQYTNIQIHMAVKINIKG